MAKKTIVVKQVASAARRPAKQTATLKGLGLNKMNRTRELEDTPSVRGMVNKISPAAVTYRTRPARNGGAFLSAAQRKPGNGPDNPKRPKPWPYSATSRQKAPCLNERT